MTEITTSSFGPNGLNKLVINTLEKLFLTSDAGTILRELEVEHPAARLILLASQQQEKELGDGSNLVVLLAGELLKNAEELIRIGIRPSIIVEGFEMAYTKALAILEDLSIGQVPKESLVKSVISSKQLGYESLLTRLVMEAHSIASQSNNAPNATESFSPENVRCIKILGGSLDASRVVAGMVLEREPVGVVSKVKDAKVAIFACPINITRTETKGTVLIKGAQDLLDFSKGEERILQDQIQAIADAGVNVVITGETIGELALHFLERHQIMALKVPSKFDLRRLCKAVGATPLARLGAPTEEELGRCDVVEAEEIGGQRCTLFRQEHHRERSAMATIILRSNTQSLLDDVERAIEDALFTLRNCHRDGRVVAGAGACELEIARRLREYGETTPGIAQYAIKKFAESFEVVPRVLGSNAGLDTTQLLSSLYWEHDQGHTCHGIVIRPDVEQADLEEFVSDASHIADLLSVKKSAIHLATDAAITVLRVDQIIMAKQATGPKARPAGPQDADD